MAAVTLNLVHCLAYGLECVGRLCPSLLVSSVSLYYFLPQPTHLIFDVAPEGFKALFNLTLNCSQKYLVKGVSHQAESKAAAVRDVVLAELCLEVDHEV